MSVTTRTVTCQERRSSRTWRGMPRASAHPFGPAPRFIRSSPSGPGGFVIRTSTGDLRAAQVVVCTRAYQRPHRSASARTLPSSLLQIALDAYRNPDSLPAGDVLVIGSGQSGCQLAEELHEVGAGSSWPAGGHRGARVGSEAGTSSGGRSRRASSTPRCRPVGPDRPMGRQHRGDRPPRRSRPPPADAPGVGGDADRPQLPRRLASSSRQATELNVRGRPVRLTGTGPRRSDRFVLRKW
jgi:cation diffusion facilitator CzcD-associated flavoprotein CzcO